MKKWSVFLTSLLLLSQSWAAPAGHGYVTEAANGADCRDCMTRGTSTGDALLDFAKNMQAISNGALHVDKIVSNTKKYAPECNGFVDDGEYQDMGKEVVEEINRSENRELRDNPRGVNILCPRYHELSKGERDGFWVLFAAGWSQKETSCQEKPKERPGPRSIKGRTPILAGILQLDKNYEQTYAYGELCEKGDYKTSQRSFKCGFSMLTGLQKFGYSLLSDGSYWEVLRPNAKPHRGHRYNGATEIRQSIANYVPCFKSPGEQASAKRNNEKRVAQQ